MYKQTHTQIGDDSIKVGPVAYSFGSLEGGCRTLCDRMAVADCERVAVADCKRVAVADCNRLAFGTECNQMALGTAAAAGSMAAEPGCAVVAAETADDGNRVALG